MFIQAQKSKENNAKYPFKYTTNEVTFYAHFCLKMAAE